MRPMRPLGIPLKCKTFLAGTRGVWHKTKYLVSVYYFDDDDDRDV